MTRSVEFQHKSFATKFGIFLGLYFIGLSVYRYSRYGAAGVIEMLWFCNVSLVLASIGCLTHNRQLFAVSVSLIAFAHLSWYFDVILYSLGYGMPFGRATYMLWPDTTWLDNVSSGHHGWFLPIAFYLLRDNGGLTVQSLVLSMPVFATFMVLASFTPVEMNGRYMNVNQAHGMWKDVHTEWTHVCDPPKTPRPVWLYINFCFIQLVNTLHWIVLRIAYEIYIYFSPPQSKSRNKSKKK